MTTDIKELLPCPFCGGNASQPEQCNSKGRPVWEIGCGTMFCFGMRRSSKKDAIASWNTRAPVQLSAQTADPYGYVLKTGHGTAFRESLAGVEPDFVKHWVRVCTDPPVIQTEQPSLSDAEIAQHFHEAYERLASSFGYETREASRRAWANVPANNKALMTAVVAEVRALLSAQRQDSDKLEVVHKFLLGEGPLDGFYFGDSDTRRPRPAFWWRKYLRAAIANGAPK